MKEFKLEDNTNKAELKKVHVDLEEDNQNNIIQLFDYADTLTSIIISQLNVIYLKLIVNFYNEKFDREKKNLFVKKNKKNIVFKFFKNGR